MQSDSFQRLFGTKESNQVLVPNSRYRVQYKHNPSDTRPIAALSKAVGHVRNTEPLMTGEERHQRRELITLISAT